MFGNLLLKIIFFLLLAIVGAVDAPASAEADNCENKEISVSNQVAVNLWYKRDGGDCALLKKHKLFAVLPGEDFQIYSDSICETKYCSSSLKHANLKASDKDGDCRVRILTGCVLLDM